MSDALVVAFGTGAVVVLGALLLFTSARRRDTRSALSRELRRRDAGPSPFLAEEPPGDSALSGREVERQAARGRGGVAAAVVPTRTAPSVYVLPDADAVGVTRRQFFNRSIVTFFALGLSGFGAAIIAFLWPSLAGGFGSKISAGRLDDILSTIRDTREPVYLPEGRFYLNPYPTGSVSEARAVYAPSVLGGMEQGIVALYQKCPHLGCRVPWCATSQWFECPCHGSQYNRVGEKKGGPAPRGLDRFPLTVEGGTVTVDTGLVVQGPPIGTNTTGQEAEGPHCVGATEGE
jgi:cytochrome b6-f complex iron-sulfur subunit